MNFVTPDRSELDALRADALIFEQELDVRPEIAEALEAAIGFRAGRRYWRHASGRLYAIDLGDFGRGRPSMAIIYGFWPRYEPRPIDDDVIDRDLGEFMLWIADIAPQLDRAAVQQVIDWAWKAREARPAID